MITKKYKMADKIIEVTSIYEKVHEYCKGYEYEGIPDFSVCITQADIDFEAEKELKSAEIEKREPIRSTDDYREELAVYRKIAEKMPDYDTVLFHGSVIAVNGEGFLFTAKSGTGKSTHTRLWREYLGEKAVMVNDDKPFLRVEEDRIVVCGSPWNGKHGLGENIEVPLRAICVLEQAKENHIERIDFTDAIPVLMQQIYIPTQEAYTAEKALELADRIYSGVDLFRLGANMEPEAAKVAYEGMKGANL